MNSLACAIVTIFLGLVAVFIFVLFNLSASTKHRDAIYETSVLCKLPSISFSTTFVEPRIKEYEDYSNDFYLGVHKNTYSGFVYAK